jgi:hypothetical protein
MKTFNSPFLFFSGVVELSLLTFRRRSYISVLGYSWPFLEEVFGPFLVDLFSKLLPSLWRFWPFI